MMRMQRRSVNKSDKRISLTCLAFRISDLLNFALLRGASLGLALRRGAFVVEIKVLRVPGVAGQNLSATGRLRGLGG
eukprot:9493265-Pyramimonas_sp.AAC.1